VRVEGHADERGSTEYNLVLSEKRAAAVVRYLSDLGVPANRLSTVAYGEEKPADTTDHAKNRRAELRVVERRRVSKN
jgi:peptidoglycan-associated lipoprotein